MWIGPENYKKVGTRLATLRKQAGLKQAELAVRLGKPQSFVSSYESGQRRVDILELQVIAKALALDPVQVFKLATGTERKKLLLKATRRGPV